LTAAQQLLSSKHTINQLSNYQTGGLSHTTPATAHLPAINNTTADVMTHAVSAMLRLLDACQVLLPDSSHNAEVLCHR